MRQMQRVFVVLLTVLCAGQTLSFAQQTDGKIYWMGISSVPLAYMPEFIKFSQNQLVPAQAKAGYHHIGGWQTIVGNIQEVVVIVEFDNMEAYQKARANLMASSEWKALAPDLAKLVTETHSRFMIALPNMNVKMK